MYSGLLPKGLTKDDLSTDDEEHEDEDVDEKRLDGQSCAGASAAGSAADARTVRGAGGAAAAAPEGGAPGSMPGIPQDLWHKFQDLRKKKDEFKAAKIPPKRKRNRHMKGSSIGAKSGEPAETRRSRTTDDFLPHCNADPHAVNIKRFFFLFSVRQHQEKQEKHWNELKQYFGVNDRFQPPACSKPAPKSGLERNIEKAIAEGDIEKAEEMSDRLATREMAVKITNAADCRDFVKHRQEEEALRAAQKRKKQIAWGFEAKKRWETKSNMGYM
ncbi:protein FAM204A [Xenentodon cancila]